MEASFTFSTVFVLSDAAGETGEAAVRAAVIQFFPLVVHVRRVPFIQNQAQIDAVVAEAKNMRALIVFTLVIPELRDYLLQQASMYQVVSIDLLGPIISNLEKVLNRQARHEPGLIHQLDEDYFKKIEAVEFAVRYDDGKDIRGIFRADIILLGVSRTSKTPLSMYLAHKGFKVANVPLIPELTPPVELFSVSPHKIIGLQISVAHLIEIRKERLKVLGLSDEANYVNRERIENELLYASQFMQKLGCRVVEVTNKAVEETAGIILELFNE